MLKHTITKIPNTTASFVCKESDKLFKIVINDPEDLKNVILYVNNTLPNNALFQTEFMGIRPDEYGRLSLIIQFVFGQNFFFTEEMFLKDLDIYTNVSYNQIIKSMCRINIDLKRCYEKYKLLVE